jgi:hypothetical protein
MKLLLLLQNIFHPSFFYFGFYALHREREFLTYTHFLITARSYGRVAVICHYTAFILFNSYMNHFK